MGIKVMFDVFLLFVCTGFAYSRGIKRAVPKIVEEVKQEDELTLILKNIDNYNGTPAGQVQW